MLDAVMNELLNQERGVWIQRSIIVKEILKGGYESVRNRAQVEGHLRSLFEQSVKCSSEETAGILIRKVGKTVEFRLNY